MKKVVLFDKGDLLTDNGRKWQKFLEAVKLFHPEFNADRLDIKRMKILNRSHRGKMSAKEELVELLRAKGMSDEKIEAFMKYSDERGIMKNPVYPQVPEILLALKERGYRLCVVSDTAKTAKELMHDLEGIENFVDGVYSSAEFGKIKGEGLLPEVLAIERPDRVFFVCHDDDEYEAGVRAGIKTIQLKDGSEILKVLELIP